MSSDDEPLVDAAHRAEVARKVVVRRVKRRFKAAASIGLALMAGAFLACAPNKSNKEKSRVPVPPNPTTPSVGALPSYASASSASSAGAPVDGVPRASASTEPDAAAHGGRASTNSGASTSGSTAIVPAGKAPQKAPSIDRDEHRKGMPVPDNLLE